MSATADLHEVDDMSDHEPTPIHDRVDGRSLRRERNRDAVINALLAIIREGNFEPGGAEIAQRAGVSHRSVFRYFDDLGDLVRTAITHELTEAIPLGTIDDLGQGTLEHRIEQLVSTRLAMYDHIHGVATVARARALTIPEIDEEFTEIVAMFRTIMHEHLAPEVATFPEADREFVIDAALVLVSWDAYDMQRRLFRQSDDWIHRSWVTSLTSLLTQ
jgi:TetR/AcrR family transcriptional regulator, regulator of autoinduction and epiphytic fitness